MAEWTLADSYHYEGHRVKFGIKGNGPAIVLIHGTPWSSYNLRHLIDGLSQTHTVYYYDLLGYGQSDKPEIDISLGIQDKLLIALIEHWGLDKPVGLGHDFGGATLLRTQVLHNAPFQRLILIDPVALSPWGSAFFNHVKQHEAAFAGTPDYIHEAIVKAYINTASAEPLAQDILSTTIEPWLGPHGKSAFYRQIAQADERYTDEVQPHYSRIDVPSLILWGEDDQWIPLERGKKLHASMPASTFHSVSGAGHLIIEEKPAWLMRQITTFLTPESGL